ncbi:MAG: ADP-glyceromanno-heptose 6-epimerase, partial [Chlamydiia bacterium]|nr:ADP-glyceromanno-heptose 6-epimerase [Chlamydiia bacterium]
VICDDLKTGEKWKNLVKKRFKKIVSRHELFNYLKNESPKFSAVFHLGACSSTTESDASYLLENNTHFSIRLAEYCLSKNIRLIYASSAATYGDGQLGFSDDHALLEELVPLNMYGYSKHLFDLWALREGVLDKMTGLKFFNVYGPNENHKGRMASAITRMLPSIQNEGVVKLFKSSEPDKFRDGEQERDFIYIKDAVNMTVGLLSHEAYGIFNIGTGKPTRWRELAGAVFRALDMPEKIEFIEMPSDLIGKYQNTSCAMMTKLQGVLGDGVCCQPMEASVSEYVREYLVEDRRW